MKLIDYLKTKFDHIVVFDYEFQVKPGDNPKAVSLTAKDLISGCSSPCILPSTKCSSIILSMNVVMALLSFLACAIALGNLWSCSSSQFAVKLGALVLGVLG